jgi:hypothetical protein
MLVGKVLVNRNKKSISNFRQEDFVKLLKDLENKRPSDAYLSRLQTKHSRYFSNLLQQKKLLDLSLQNYRQDLYEPTLLNIIVFNDNCTVR